MPTKSGSKRCPARCGRVGTTLCDQISAALLKTAYVSRSKSFWTQQRRARGRSLLACSPTWFAQFVIVLPSLWIAVVLQEWYGWWLSGVFLDETSHTADDLDRGDRAMCAKYKEYRQHVQKQMGEGATVR